jgi:hypothetical protein
VNDRFQLVIQFDAVPLSDFDRFIALDEPLRQQLANLAEIDGHDFGSGEFNFFLETDDPPLAFERVFQFLQSKGLDRGMRAAFRKLDDDDFVPLWPADLEEFFIA